MPDIVSSPADGLKGNVSVTTWRTAAILLTLTIVGVGKPQLSGHEPGVSTARVVVQGRDAPAVLGARTGVVTFEVPENAPWSAAAKIAMSVAAGFVLCVLLWVRRQAPSPS